MGAELRSKDQSGAIQRQWAFYVCHTCGGVVSAWAMGPGQEVVEHFPATIPIDKEIPDRARAYLEQAQESLHAPAGSVMLAASAVDAMLKERKYIAGSLYQRIEQASADHVLTSEMAAWAHAVRLDANDQRHADHSATLPTTEEAKRVLDFARALGTYLFVLPKRIQRGIAGK